MSESHLARAAAQDAAAPFLFSDLPIEVQSRMFKREQDRGDWTAARLFSQKRAIYEVIVRLLGAGLHVRLIADLCEVTEKSVVAVREAEPVAVTAFREGLGVKRRNVIARLADNIAAALELQDMEKAAKIAKDLAVAWNILDGQERLDNGSPTAILRIDEVPALDAYRDFVKTIIVQAEVLPQTGSGDGCAGTKEGGPGGDGRDSTPEDTANG